ncbi:MAG: class I SAM-dependent methyltransferase [Candidatus Micrarchaeota archaeon]|nr:class I SAM-dependent methyltransferase [Candidatus Micrarchaeota archaeon]
MESGTYKMTRLSHDRLAKQWVNQPSYFDSKIKEGHVNRFFRAVGKGALVLDAGCGLGKEAKMLISKGLRVISIDTSKGMIREARKIVPKGDFRRIDMLDLKFKDKNFDAVWCFSSIHHLRKADARLALRGFNRVLKDRGILAISSKEGKGWYYNIALVNGMRLRRFIKQYTKPEMEKLLTESGFKVIDIRVDRSSKRKDWSRVVAIGIKTIR